MSDTIVGIYLGKHGKKIKRKIPMQIKKKHHLRFFLNLGTLSYSISAFISIKNMLHYFIEKEDTAPQSRVLFQSLHVAVPYTRSDSEFQFQETNTHLSYIFIHMRSLTARAIGHTLKLRRNYRVQRAIILRTSDPRKDPAGHRSLGTLFTLFSYGTICSYLLPSISIFLSLIYIPDVYLE